MSLVVDSSGWVEFLAGEPQAEKVAQFLSGKEEIITPTLVVYEVYKKMKKTISEEAALFAVTQMQRTRTVPLDNDLALYAADLSLQHNLAMADAIVYATARTFKARLVTSDRDFQNLPEVILI